MPVVCLVVRSDARYLRVLPCQGRPTGRRWRSRSLTGSAPAAFLATVRTTGRCRRRPLLPYLRPLGRYRTNGRRGLGLFGLRRRYPEGLWLGKLGNRFARRSCLGEQLSFALGDPRRVSAVSGKTPYGRTVGGRAEPGCRHPHRPHRPPITKQHHGKPESAGAAAAADGYLPDRRARFPLVSAATTGGMPISL